MNDDRPANGTGSVKSLWPVVALFAAMMLIYLLFHLRCILFSKTAARETSALMAVAELLKAEEDCHARHGRYAGLVGLDEMGLIDAGLLASRNTHYCIEVRAQRESYEIVATPKRYGRMSATRSFYADKSGRTHEADKGGVEANAADEPID